MSNTLNILGDWAWDEGTVTRNDFVLYDIASDDVQKKWSPDGDQPWMDEVQRHSYIASNPAFNGIWSYLYEGVSRTNMALSYLNNDEIISAIEMESNLRNRLRGEVYFLRAFYYFDLVTNFGDIPLLLTPIEDFSDAYEAAKRVEASVVWDQIKDDLAKAYDYLPHQVNTSKTDFWRASIGAVIAMQAKVALYSEDYNTVISKVDELDKLKHYQLNAHYFDAFDMTKKLTEQEVVFAYNHRSKVTPREGNGLCALLGWGFIAPTESFINEFEPNDPRLSYTVDVNKKAVYKLLGEVGVSNQGNDDAESNKIYIRYADVLLWKAEAFIETGKLAEAIDLINKIRERARNTPSLDGVEADLTDRPMVSDKKKVKEWLIHERRVELGFESHRFRDLKRWGLAKEVLSDQGFADKNYLYPIPQKDIDKSGGLLTQNPGY